MKKIVLYSLIFLVMSFNTTSYCQNTIEIIWQKTLGGSKCDMASDIIATPDGGYVIVGHTNSNDGDVLGWHEGYDENDYPYPDSWIVKLDKDGNMVWQKTFGGSGEDIATSITVTPDDGYIVAGWTGSSDGDVSGNHGDSDFWIVKLDKDGNIVWRRTFGGSGWDAASAIAVTPDGGYIVVGDTKSNDGDIKGWHEGYDEYGTPFPDFWIVKLGWK